MPKAIKWRIRGSYVVVREDQPEKVTKGGIALPETSMAKREPRGVIVGLGTRCKERYPDLKVGDHVIFAYFGGQEVSFNGETLLLMPATAIIAAGTPDAEVDQSNSGQSGTAAGSDQDGSDVSVARSERSQES